MPSPPPFPYKSAPDGEVPPAAPATIIQDPTFSITFPFGCGEVEAIVQLDRAPLMSREPSALPDIPGGGWSYAKFIEYLDMGITPHDDEGSGSGYLWSGRGCTFWEVWIDGAFSGVNIGVPDGFVGTFGVPVPPPAGTDWTTVHTIQLRGTYFDRPSYSEYWINPSTVGIIAFGPTTDPADPSVIYTLDGTGFGCASRSLPFFPSVFWGSPDYYDPWVAAHAGVADITGPVDRNGNTLALSGPWGSGVDQQFLSSGPGVVVCTGAPIIGHFPDQPGGAGDVYSSGLADLVETTTYDRVQYDVATGIYDLDTCTPETSDPIFDSTRAFAVG